jgi:cellulose synthase/poly-beta-1,6-N-acetylglucosamine synthase-like glycosyltransferase
VAVNAPHTMISTETLTREAAGPALSTPTAPLIDIVVPVYNERATLERSIRRLHGFLQANMPFAWRIVIAVNASTDGTSVIAGALASE